MSTPIIYKKYERINSKNHFGMKQYCRSWRYEKGCTILSTRLHATHWPWIKHHWFK